MVPRGLGAPRKAMESRARIEVRGPRELTPRKPGTSRGMRTGERDAEARGGAIYVTLKARTTDHFLRRLEERGGDAERLVWEGHRLAAAGWLRPIHRRDYNFVVPGFGQIRLRLDRRIRGFVAVTFLPLLAG